MTKKSVVAVVGCRDYSEQRVYAALRNGISLLGGTDRFIRRDEKILVKPNFLHSADESSAVTTHPAVIRSFLRLLNDCGCTDVSFGDSPARGSCLAAAEALGLEDGAFGASIAPMSEAVEYEFPEGKTCRKFRFCKEAVEADAIFNLCKMKTHALERITGAVKNVYGLVCGKHKAAGHVEYPNASVFARMLADIHRALRPRLHIMDGITAMEGNGPGSGDPVHMGVMLFSEDPVALDTVFCWLIDLDPLSVPTNEQGHACGIGSFMEDEIDVVMPGEDGSPLHLSKQELFERYGKADFNVARSGNVRSLLGTFSRVMTKLSRPVIDTSKCVRCGVCADNCPVTGSAVTFKNGRSSPPEYDYSKCIRCYCCQELCPAGAIRKR